MTDIPKGSANACDQPPNTRGLESPKVKDPEFWGPDSLYQLRTRNAESLMSTVGQACTHGKSYGDQTYRSTNPLTSRSDFGSL